MRGMPSTVRSIGVAVAALCLIVLAACGGSSGGTGQSTASDVPVRIALVPGFGSLPIQVAVTQGFFTKHGVNAQIVENTSTASFGPGLGKQFDFILSTPMDFVSAASKGIDITAVSGMYINSAKSQNNVLLTKEDSVRTIADLKGKRIGVVSLAGTAYGAMIYELQRAGIAKGDVTMVATPFATMEDQLDAGNLDAAMSTAPFWSSTVAKGYRIIEDVPFTVAGEGTPSAFFSSSKAYAAANPRIVDGFRAALSDAIAWIQQNPDRARAELVTWLKLPQAVVAAAPLPALSTAIDAGKLEPFVAIARVSGQVTGIMPDLKSLVWTGGTT